MIRNYITVAIRNLLRNKLYAAINLVGLGVGVAVCVLAAAFIRYEMSWDSHHVNRDRIFRILWATPEKEIVTTGTSGPLAQALKETFPEIVETARAAIEDLWVLTGSESIRQRFCMGDASLLRMFNLPLLRGNVDEVLANPYSLVITESAARRWFGEDDPIGKAVTVESLEYDGEYTVTGVMQDLPHNASHPFRFDMLTPYHTLENPYVRWDRWIKTATGGRRIFTFAELRSPDDAESLLSKLPVFLESKFGPEMSALHEYRLQPMTDWHTENRRYGLGQGRWDGDRETLYQVGAIALLVLAVACINFVNLSTARASTRGLEVGIRKTSGAQKSQLFAQFTVETFALTGLAILLGAGISELAYPVFRERVAPTLPEQLSPVSDVLPFLPLFLVGIGLLAGAYPALVLASMDPIRVLKKASKTDSHGAGFRRALVLVQFASCILLISGTVVIQKQVSFLMNKGLGFDRDLVISMPLFGRDRARKSDWGKHLSYRYRGLKSELLRHPNILKASAYRWTPGTHGGMTRVMEVDGKRVHVKITESDEDFLDMFDIPLAAGRNFRFTSIKDISANRKDRQYLINETAARHFGWYDSDPSEALGKTFHLRDGGKHRDGRVVGVFRDYNSGSLADPIQPMAIFFSADLFYHLGVKVRPDRLHETIAVLRETWERVLPERPFEVVFLDEEIGRLYQRHELTGRLISDFSIIAILLSCGGLFGLASFTVERRRKEIGIRKTLGATIGSIVVTLTRESGMLVIASNVIAWPIGFYLMSSWLERFAYRIDLHVGFFAIAGGVALLVAVGTVAHQAIRAAKANPVDALRTE